MLTNRPCYSCFLLTLWRRIWETFTVLSNYGYVANMLLCSYQVVCSVLLLLSVRGLQTIFHALRQSATVEHIVSGFEWEETCIWLLCLYLFSVVCSFVYSTLARCWLYYTFGRNTTSHAWMKQISYLKNKYSGTSCCISCFWSRFVKTTCT